MKPVDAIVSDIACWVTASAFMLGLMVLAVHLYRVQIVDSAAYSYRNDRQSVRRVQTAGSRGCIKDRNGILLAGNRPSLVIVLNTEKFQKKSWAATAEAISNAIEHAATIVKRANGIDMKTIKRHVSQELAMPLVVWRDISHETLARFCEHQNELVGFNCIETEERYYPGGSLAAHALGYVGRQSAEGEADDVKFNFYLPELRGRTGLESYYDGYLRGVPGETRIRVDARGFAMEDWVVVEARSGLDLRLSLDSTIQRAVERELAGCRGAGVVMDPRNGEVLAIASAPTFNLNGCVPRMRAEYFAYLNAKPDEIGLNRATGGAYAPGSTFKTITSMAGLRAGYPYREQYVCCGFFELGPMFLRCSRRWGHGELDLQHALRESCNPYFCNLGMTIGTNALVAAAHDFGLGRKTGIDLGVDVSGVVPDAEWKQRVYHEKWFQGDLAQMSIGQGMLLVTPLQMARAVGAIATGYLVTPHLRLDAKVERRRLPFEESQLAVVREGMRMVVDGGTGKLGGKGVPVEVCGKTGTAEVGKGETRRKNTWFIAYAPAKSPRVAVAMIIENGVSGGSTTAPKVANVLKTIFEGEDR